jgi:AcrR family transcriptional regulator
MQVSPSGSPPRPASLRRQRRWAGRKRAIYEAALGLFARNGYDRVTVDEIVAAADVSKGTFFNYFPSKEHLLVEYRRSLLDFIHEYGDGLEGDSARALCKRYFRKLTRRIKAEGDRYEVLFQEVVSRPHLFALEPPHRRAYRAYFLRFLETGRAAGEIPEDCDLELLAETIRDLWTGASVNWALDERRGSLEGIILRRIDFLFDTLATGSR